MRTLLGDVRYALRGLLKKPGYSAIVILTLALGIGANTAIFSVADATLRRGLPYPEADRLVAIWETRPRDDGGQLELSWPNYLDLRARQRSFSETAGYYTRGVSLAGARGSELVHAGHVTGAFFEVLGTPVAVGRALAAGDTRLDAPAVAMVTHGFWQRRHGGDPALLGQTIEVNGTPTTIVGILPPSFAFAPFSEAELVVPARPDGSFAARRNLHWLQVVGRLAPGVTIEAARAEVGEIARALSVENPETNKGGGAHVLPLADQILGKVRPILWVLLAAVGLVLLVACANVANLVLARQAGREKELAIRAALGASRARLFALLTVDSLVHAMLAGAAGTLVAVWGVDALIGAIPAPILASMPYLAGARVDLAALGFALVVAFVSGLAVGVLPALRASRPDLHDRLKEEGRGTPGRARGRLRDALVVAEVALAFVLLAGAGLVTRSLWSVLSVNPGFDASGLTAAQLLLPDALAKDAEHARATRAAVLARVAALPGVEGVSTVNMLPVGDGGNTIRFVVEDKPPPPGVLEPEGNIRTVGHDYFSLMRVPLTAGRFFDADERENTVIVNRRLAEQLFDGDAVGKRIVFTFAADQPAREIVGVVGNEHLGPLDRAARPAVYVPASRAGAQSFSLVVRGPVQADALVRAVAEIGASIAVHGVSTMSDRIERQPWMFVRRFPAILVAAFAALALALATIGIYGVLAVTVRQRTHEIGIRRAVGAQGHHIAGMLLGRSAVLAGLGVAIGLAVALATMHLLGSLLFGVSPSDPLTLAAAGLLLLLVSLVASWLPARGAMAIDPLEALR